VLLAWRGLAFIVARLPEFSFLRIRIKDECAVLLFRLRWRSPLRLCLDSCGAATFSRRLAVMQSSTRRVREAWLPNVPRTRSRAGALTLLMLSGRRRRQRLCPLLHADLGYDRTTPVRAIPCMKPHVAGRSAPNTLSRFAPESRRCPSGDRGHLTTPRTLDGWLSD